MNGKKESGKKEKEGKAKDSEDEESGEGEDEEDEEESSSSDEEDEEANKAHVPAYVSPELPPCCDSYLTCQCSHGLLIPCCLVFAVARKHIQVFRPLLVVSKRSDCLECTGRAEKEWFLFGNTKL